MALRYYIERNGVPVEVDRDTHQAWAYEGDNRRVALTIVYDYRVSTVFLTIDHNWRGEGGPILYETNISKRGDDDSVGQWRYRTREAAKAGHDKCVRFLRQGFVPARREDERGVTQLGAPNAGYPMKPEQQGWKDAIVRSYRGSIQPPEPKPDPEPVDPVRARFANLFNDEEK